MRRNSKRNEVSSDPRHLDKKWPQLCWSPFIKSAWQCSSLWLNSGVDRAAGSILELRRARRNSISIFSSQKKGTWLRPGPTKKVENGHTVNIQERRALIQPMAGFGTMEHLRCQFSNMNTRE